MTKFEEALEIVQALSPLEKVRLVEEVMASLEHDLVEKRPRRSLHGIWAGVDVSAEDIDEARREMWGNFPREDI